MAARHDGSITISTAVDQSGFAAGVKQLESGLKGVTTAVKKVALAMGLAFGVTAIVSFGKESVKATNDLANALIGLQSILDGQGRSFFMAQQFIEGYVQDGLIPATQAITAYKNLALRGYDDSQIQQVLIALKDSAAFGRQASYSLGEAVASATEGLKNENSILVDNAGVTKNVAKMWDEYARSIGTTANNLSQQQKIQAEVTGILEETKYQVGDAAKVAGTYSGQLLQLQYRFNDLKVAVGNAILPIAQAVIPSINAMITGFTRLANIVAQVTAALFGKQATQQEKVASTAGAAAKGQQDLAEATTAAGKAAKGALGAFDELNVLQQPSDVGADSGAPDPVGFGDIGAGGGELFGDVTVSPAVQAAIDTLQKMLEPLKNINFDNLKNAFERLKAAVEPITQALFDGLMWAYDNILVPLAAWVIEDYLPVWLDAASAALDLLTAAIDALKPLGAWLWENFLKPLAAWTGGVIVSILETVTDALRGFSDWIRDNEGLVQNMTITVGVFFAAWKATELMAFIQMSGGFAGAFARIGDAIRVATVEKIKDMYYTAVLTAMYAKDFVVSVAKGTAELVKQAAQWVVSTGLKIADTAAQIAMTAATTAWAAIGAVATAVTTAFGAAIAFLTSPIGLVILAIGAIIAIVVLLIKNWDMVKATAISVWEAIKGAWSVVANWFDTNVVQPVATFFTGLWDGVQKTFTTAWDFMSDAFKGYINGWIGLIEGFINFFIKAINLLISGLNKISFDIPSWVPGVGGKSFGINIPSVPVVKIPRLATGAVIPPNAEFLAVLGDQRHGRNLEAPEGLIRQIIREEMGGLGGSQEITIRFEGSMAQFVRELKPHIDKESRRRGVSLVRGVT